MNLERVLIVGGGIAGLATASGLVRAGVECVIAERSRIWQPLGAGIVLNVNAMSALRSLGIDDSISKIGFTLGEGQITDQKGLSLARTNFGSLTADFGPTIALHRADLHATLLDTAQGAEIRLGTTIKDITQHSDRVEVRLTDGLEASFDLVIGADGIRSRTRELVFGPPAIDYSGYTCWRFVVDARLNQNGLCEMWGRGKRVGVVPIGTDRFYVFAVCNRTAGVPDEEPGRLDRSRSLFSEFGGDVPHLLDAIEDSASLIHGDINSIQIGDWFKDRVVLIGDAVHAMTPNMGQGAGMALEDAAVLVELLGAGGSLSNILESYRMRREPRVQWVQNQSRRIGRIGQMWSALACRLRDFAAKLILDRLSTRALRSLVSKPI